jgi:hypothetical protein
MIAELTVTGIVHNYEVLGITVFQEIQDPQV